MLEEQNPTNKHVARFIAILSLYSYEMQDQKSLYQISKAIKKAYLEKDVFDLDINEEKLSEIQFHSFDEQLLEILINLSDSKKEAIEQLIKDNLIAKYNFCALHIL